MNRTDVFAIADSPDAGAYKAVRPDYYRTADGKAELFDFVDELDFCSGSAMKYIFRSGRKDPDKAVEDLEKAIAMIRRRIMVLRRREDA